MRLSGVVVAAVAIALATAAHAQVSVDSQGEGKRHPPRIAVVSINLPPFPDAAREAAETVTGLSVDLYGLGAGRLPSIDGVDLSTYDLVFVENTGTRLLSFAQQFEEAKKHTKVLSIPNASTGASAGYITGNIDPSRYPDAVKYWENGVTENYVNLFNYLAREILGQEREVAPPQIIPNLAIYHPDAERQFENLNDYENWMAQRLPDADKRARIGIVFYRHVVFSRTSGMVDALIAEIERQGGLPVPIWRAGGGDLVSVIAPSPHLDALIVCVNPLVPGNGLPAVEEAKKIDAPLLGCQTDYERTPDQWRSSIGGFAPSHSGKLALAELEGVFEPMMVGARNYAEDGAARNDPIDEQIQWRVERAMRWAALKRKPNFDKTVLITYHSEDASKADLGSDPDNYLDVQSTLAVLLQRLRNEGYDTGSAPLPDRDAVTRMMIEKGRNIGVWDKEALRERLADGTAYLVPEAEYLEWYKALPEPARNQLESIWGAAPGRLMVHENEQGQRFFVIPALRFGKIILAPQPVWGLLQDDAALENLGSLPPHHQYAAFFLWMQKSLKADVFLPLWSQISLMPGKLEGPMRSEWAGVLIDAVPHIRPLPLHGAGGASNKRRVNALTIGYMPAFHQGGLSPDLQKLRDVIAQYEGKGDDGALTDLDSAIREKVSASGMDRGFSAPLDTLAIAYVVAEAKLWLEQTEKAIIPRGGATMGVPPSPQTVTKIVRAMIEAAGTPITEQTVADVLSEDASASLAPDLTERVRDYAHRLNSASNEIEAVIRALSGRYIEPGPIQDAIRNPDAVPGGRNPFTLDVRALPTVSAEAQGKALADSMLESAIAKNGRVPRKVAFILWSTEAAQNEGVSEAAIFHLLGVRPVRNTRGEVADVALIPQEELGRPRVDVMATASGLYRDHFLGMLNLIAKAVRLASDAEGEGNAVRELTQEREAVLIAQGMEPELARKSALRRLFSEAPGAYSPNTQFAVKAGPQWTDDRLTGLYAGRLSHSYGEGDEGTADVSAFIANLEGVDAAIFSRSSNALGLLDNPMSAAYLGGLGMAVREQTGRQIDNYILNARDPANMRVETVERFLGQELASRYLNPEWIRGMQETGYNGARYFANVADNLLLWDITTPNLVQDGDWQALHDTFIKDRHGLGLKDYFETNNPYARQGLLETMRRAIDRGSWTASDEIRQSLDAELADNIAAYGTSGGRPYRELASDERAVITSNHPAGQTSPAESSARDVMEKADMVPTRSASAPVAAPAAPAPAMQPSAASGMQSVTGMAIATAVKEKASVTHDSKLIYWLVSLGGLFLVVLGFITKPLGSRKLR